MMNFFKRRRDELGLTQKAIAERLKVTIQAVSAWEQGEVMPLAGLWDAIAVAYETDIAVLSAEILKMIRAKRKSAKVSAA